MTRRPSAALLAALVAVLVALSLALPAGARPAEPGHRPPRPHHPRTVDVQVLGLNDFHGALQPPSGTFFGAPAGGAEYLATLVRGLEAANPNTAVVGAGDLIGASPLLSALFHDEPTIEAMNQIGLDASAVGNHEFDEGATELLRMQRGGCHPVDGCQDGDGFGGARFRYLAANVFRQQGRHERTLLPPYAIQNFRGTKVAFVGMTLEGTPAIVTPSGIQGLDFRDEADTVNALVPRLRRQGAQAIVVLLHEGGLTTGGLDDCPGVSGPIVDIVGRMDDEIDAVISGHTHRAYNCRLANAAGRDIPVTSASSNGRALTDMDLTIDRRSGEVTAVTAHNLAVRRDVPPAADITALIAEYDALAAPLRDRVIGEITASITKTADDSGENPAGNLIADAQLAATTPADLGGAEIAFMNPGGVRDPGFVFDDPAGTGGDVTYGEAFTVQPFGNSLVTMTLTGAQVLELLKQQWCGGPGPRILLPSAGFTYTWDESDDACAGDGKVVTGSVQVDGAPLVEADTYRVTVNSFLADGGDSFPVLTQGTDRLGGAVDLDALTAYLEAAGGPVAPPALDRIDVQP
jgi:5'-nucleotidase